MGVAVSIIHGLQVTTQLVISWYWAIAVTIITDSRRMIMEWIPAEVGCYWSAGEFYISTYMHGDCARKFPDSGYELTQNRKRVGRYPTLGEAKKAAEYLYMEVSK